jgi:predicted alpha/beta superfamily hydrolase
VIKSLLAVCLLFFGACGFTAHAELLPGHADSLDSAQLHQKRAIDVYLPKESKKDPARRYETIYVLDGDWNAKLVVQTVDFLQATGWMPPVIVVSVPNFFDDKGVNSRDRDLTPTPQPNQPGSGGAPQFIAFLKTELIPYVNQHYPSSGVNLIHGHSYGGLFLNYVIATAPALFDGYLMLDPAMWWDNKAVSTLLTEKLPSTPTQGKGIFIAGRTGSAFKGMGVDSLPPAYEKAPRALHRQITAYPNETHDSLKFKGTYDGLRYLYRGYSQDKMSIGPDDGIVDPSWPLPLEADTDRFDIHYTTDGSTPTLDSPVVNQSFAVTDPASVRLK